MNMRCYDTCRFESFGCLADVVDDNVAPLCVTRIGDCAEAGEVMPLVMPVAASCTKSTLVCHF